MGTTLQDAPFCCLEHIFDLDFWQVFARHFSLLHVRESGGGPYWPSGSAASFLGFCEKHAVASSVYLKLSAGSAGHPSALRCPSVPSAVGLVRCSTAGPVTCSTAGSVTCLTSGSVTCSTAVPVTCPTRGGHSGAGPGGGSNRA